jgi:hypothetical protein
VSARRSARVVSGQPSAKARTARTPSPGKKLPRVPKGKRAGFFEDPGVDQLFAIATALTAEVSVLAERLRTLEGVLRGRKVLGESAIEDYVIDDAESAERAVERERLIERVFQVLEAYAARDAAAADSGGRLHGR